MSTDNAPADILDVAERDRLAYAIETRFAEPREGAASAVREAEQALEDAKQHLEEAIEAKERQQYRSDPLVFMRDGLDEEVDGLERKSNPKKVRAAYRFLMDRAVELAVAEVRGYHDDRASEEHHRTRGIEASREAVDRAERELIEARDMQERVQRAEESARTGLKVLFAKFDHPDGSA